MLSRLLESPVRPGARLHCSSRCSWSRSHRGADRPGRAAVGLQARGARADRRPHRPLSGSARGADPDGLDVPARDRPGRALRQGQREPQGRPARRGAQEADAGTTASSRSSPFRRSSTMMNDKLDWTQKLGDAFLDQQKELMDADPAPAREGPGGRATSRAPPSRRSWWSRRRRPPSASRQVVVQQAPPQIITIEPANPAGRLRADLQPDGRLRGLALSRLPAVLLLSAGLCLAGGDAALSFGVGMAVGARALGQLQLGPRRRERQREPVQQLLAKT